MWLARNMFAANCPARLVVAPIELADRVTLQNRMYRGDWFVKKVLMTAAAVAAAMVGGPVLAQTLDPYVPYEGFYIAGGGGAIWGLSSNPGVSTGTGWLAGGKLGYDFLGPRVDLEVGYGRIPNNV